MAVNQMYCCKECGDKYRRTHNVQELYPSLRFECACCGKTVITEEGSRDKRTRFCSPECEREYWRHQYLKENVSTHQRMNFHSVEEYFSYERRTNNG